MTATAPFPKSKTGLESCQRTPVPGDRSWARHEDTKISYQTPPLLHCTARLDLVRNRPYQTLIFLRHHKCSAKLPPERLLRADSPTTLLKHLLSFNKYSLCWEGQLSHAFLLNNVTEPQLAVRWRLGSVPLLACVTLGKSFPFPEPPPPPTISPTCRFTGTIT